MSGIELVILLLVAVLAVMMIYYGCICYPVIKEKLQPGLLKTVDPQSSPLIRDEETGPTAVVVQPLTVLQYPSLSPEPLSDESRRCPDDEEAFDSSYELATIKRLPAQEQQQQQQQEAATVCDAPPVPLHSSEGEKLPLLDGDEEDGLILHHPTSKADGENNLDSGMNSSEESVKNDTVPDLLMSENVVGEGENMSKITVVNDHEEIIPEPVKNEVPPVIKTLKHAPPSPVVVTVAKPLYTPYIEMAPMYDEPPLEIQPSKTIDSHIRNHFVMTCVASNTVDKLDVSEPSDELDCQEVVSEEKVSENFVKEVEHFVKDELSESENELDNSIDITTDILNGNSETIDDKEDQLRSRNQSGQSTTTESSDPEVTQYSMKEDADLDSTQKILSDEIASESLDDSFLPKIVDFTPKRVNLDDNVLIDDSRPVLQQYNAPITDEIIDTVDVENQIVKETEENDDFNLNDDASIADSTRVFHEYSVANIAEIIDLEKSVDDEPINDDVKNYDTADYDTPASEESSDDTAESDTHEDNMHSTDPTRTLLTDTVADVEEVTEVDMITEHEGIRSNDEFEHKDDYLVSTNQQDGSPSSCMEKEIQVCKADSTIGDDEIVKISEIATNEKLTDADEVMNECRMSPDGESSQSHEDVSISCTPDEIDLEGKSMTKISEEYQQDIDCESKKSSSDVCAGSINDDNIEISCDGDFEKNGKIKDDMDSEKIIKINEITVNSEEPVSDDTENQQNMDCESIKSSDSEEPISGDKENQKSMDCESIKSSNSEEPVSGDTENQKNMDCESIKSSDSEEPVSGDTENQKNMDCESIKSSDSEEPLSGDTKNQKNMDCESIKSSDSEEPVSGDTEDQQNMDCESKKSSDSEESVSDDTENDHHSDEAQDVKDTLLEKPKVDLEKPEVDLEKPKEVNLEKVTTKLEEEHSNNEEVIPDAK